MKTTEANITKILELKDKQIFTLLDLVRNQANRISSLELERDLRDAREIMKQAKANTLKDTDKYMKFGEVDGG